MVGAGDYVFELDEELSDSDLVALTVTTPLGHRIQVWSQVELNGREVLLRQFAIYGLNMASGDFGLGELRRLVDATMEAFDVDSIQIDETRRTSGAGAGRVLRPLVFRRRKHEADPDSSSI